MFSPCSGILRQPADRILLEPDLEAADGTVGNHDEASGPSDAIEIPLAHAHVVAGDLPLRLLAASLRVPVGFSAFRSKN